jgi:hypothetical protein
MPEAKSWCVAAGRVATRYHIVLLRDDEDNGRALCGARAWSRGSTRGERWASRDEALDEFRRGYLGPLNDGCRACEAVLAGTRPPSPRAN